jgi:hypothetical protein
VAQRTFDVLAEFVAAFLALVALGVAAFVLSSEDGVATGTIAFAGIVLVFVGAIGYHLFSGPTTFVSGHEYNRTRHRLLFAGGFFALFVGMEIIAILSRVLELGGFVGLLESIAPVIVFGGPFLVSVLSAYFGGGLLLTFVIGTVPSVYFGLHTLIEEALGLLAPSPDSPWIFVVFLLPLYAYPAAFVGFVAGAGARFALSRLLYERR